MRGLRHRTGRVAAVACSIAAVVGCGVSTEPTPTRIDASDVPYGLLDAASAPATTRAIGPSVAVFLVAEDRLVEVARSVDADATLEDLVAVVADGPTSAEASMGLASALPEGHVAAVTSTRGVAVVDLRPSFATLGGRDQALAIAQVVVTLTGRPGIGRVAFTLDGTGIEVPRGDGALTTDALARDDFASIVE